MKFDEDDLPEMSLIIPRHKQARGKPALVSPWQSIRPATVSSVLFACTHNAIRSPMAEGLLKSLHGRNIYVDSCGVRSMDQPDPFAVSVMEEMDIDISRHRSKTFDELEDSSFDLIIALSPEAMHKAVDMTRTMSCDVIHWRMMDPSYIDGNREIRLQAYREVREELLKLILEEFPLETGD